MYENTREILTTEKCRSTLMLNVKKDILATVTVFLFFLFVFGLVSVFSYLVAAYVFDLGTVLPVIVVCVILTPSFIFLACHLYRAFSKIRMIKNGSFSVIQDKLDGMEEEDYSVESFSDPKRYLASAKVSMADESYRTNDVLYFAEHGRYIVNATDGGVIDYSLVGDKFYLVVYNNDIETPVAVYNTRIYKWQD